MFLRLRALVGAAVVVDHSGASVWIFAAYSSLSLHNPDASLTLGAERMRTELQPLVTKVTSGG